MFVYYIMNRFNLNIKTDGNRQTIRLPPYLQDKFRGNCLINVDNLKVDLGVDYTDTIISLKSSIFQPNSFDNELETNNLTLCYLTEEEGLTGGVKSLTHPSNKIFVNDVPNEFDIYLEVIGTVEEPNPYAIPEIIPALIDKHLTLMLCIEVLEDNHNCGCN